MASQWCAAEMKRLFAAAGRPAAASPSSAPVVCGRGDKKTRRWKRFKGSYGNARPKKEKKVERIKDKVEVPRKGGLMKMAVFSVLIMGGLLMGKDHVQGYHKQQNRGLRHMQLNHLVHAPQGFRHWCHKDYYLFGNMKWDGRKPYHQNLQCCPVTLVILSFQL